MKRIKNATDFNATKLIELFSRVQNFENNLDDSCPRTVINLDDDREFPDARILQQENAFAIEVEGRIGKFDLRKENDELVLQFKLVWWPKNESAEEISSKNKAARTQSVKILQEALQRHNISCQSDEKNFSLRIPFHAIKNNRFLQQTAIGKIENFFQKIRSDDEFFKNFAQSINHIACNLDQYLSQHLQKEDADVKKQIMQKREQSERQFAANSGQVFETGKYATNPSIYNLHKTDGYEMSAMDLQYKYKRVKIPNSPFWISIDVVTGEFTLRPDETQMYLAEYLKPYIAELTAKLRESDYFREVLSEAKKDKDYYYVNDSGLYFCQNAFKELRRNFEIAQASQAPKTERFLPRQDMARPLHFLPKRPQTTASIIKPPEPSRLEEPQVGRKSQTQLPTDNFSSHLQVRNSNADKALLLATPKIFPDIKFAGRLDKGGNIWARSSNDFIKSRGEKFKFLSRAYPNQQYDENNLPKDVKKIMFDIVIYAANKAKINFEDALDTIALAKQKGGIKNKISESHYEEDKAIIGDEETTLKMRKFSRYIQKTCEECGIYSGRDNITLGLRATFFPVKILQELSAQFQQDRNILRNLKHEVDFSISQKKAEVVNISRILQA